MTSKQILKLSPLPVAETLELLIFITKKSREFLLTHPETPLSSLQTGQYRRLEKKRLNNWPLAYLIGSQDFWGRNFKLNNKVLIPRPETELLVEEVLHLARTSDSPPTIIDIGTGSAAIIISLAKELEKNSPFYEKTEFLASDISRAALDLARRNAAAHQLEKRIKFRHGDLLGPWHRNLKGKNLIIAANLPYLNKKQIKESPTIAREPLLALDGGWDGLTYYRKLFKQLAKINYRRLDLICEISPEQKKLISDLAKKAFPEQAIFLKKDWRQKDRFLLIKYFSKNN